MFYAGAGEHRLKVLMKVIKRPVAFSVATVLLVLAMFSSVSVEEPGFSVTVTASGLN